MTSNTVIKRKKAVRDATLPFICLLLTVIMLFFGNELKDAIISGMSLAALRIIPTVFPFMILSDLWMSCAEIKRDNRFARLFENALGINGTAVIALLSGIFCGFPLGVKTAVSLYKAGAMSKDELERLSPIVNLPSLAFVISGVGTGLLGNAIIGISLYISVLIGSLVVGLVAKGKGQKSSNTNVILRQNFDLVSSVRDAGVSSLAMAAYITFFSGVIGLVRAVVPNACFVTLLSTLFEVGNSTSLIAKRGAFSPLYTLSITAFALGFSGLSVHLQAFSLMPREISRRRYLIAKLLIGIISAILVLPISFLFAIL